MWSPMPPARVERDALAVGELDREARSGPEGADVVGRPVPVRAPQPVPADAAVDEPGWRATVLDGSRSSASRASGRRLLRKTSAEASRSSNLARSAESRRSSTTLRFPRLSWAKAGFGKSVPIPNDPKAWRMGSPVGGSTLMTSAPQSARRADAEGAATQTPSSTTRRSARAARPCAFGSVTWPPRSGRPPPPVTQRVLHHLAGGVQREASPRWRRRAAPCSSPYARGSTR